MPEARTCGLEDCDRPALLNLEVLDSGDLYVPVCRECALECIEHGVGDALRFRQPAIIERGQPMKLKRDFVKAIAQAVADGLDDDEIKEAVVEEVAGDVDTRDVEQKAVEQIVDEINSIEIVDRIEQLLTEKVYGEIDSEDYERMEDLVVDRVYDAMHDDDGFLDRLVGAVAERVIAALMEDEREDEAEPPSMIGGPQRLRIRTAEEMTREIERRMKETEDKITAPIVETAENSTDGPGAAACRLCGGSAFLHRDDGSCPEVPAALKLMRME